MRKRTCDAAEKRHFITKVSYKIFFRAGLNEIKCDYIDFKQHVATDVKAFCIKQSLQAVA